MEQFKPKNFVILVVDDVRKNLQIIGNILDQVGYSTTYAVGGKQALERVKTSQPDLILLDLMMPEINGLEVCERLRNDEKYSEIPIIFLTASHESEHLLQAFQKGAVDYITKPFNASELLARVRTHLELKFTRDKLRQAFQQIQELNHHLESELTDAANYVRSLLPEPLKDEQDLIHTNWRFIPSQRLGGDCFNYYWLDSDHFILYFFDVSGHGVASALLSISIRNILSLRSFFNTNFKDPEIVLKDLNKSFSMSKHNDMYFTIWYGVYQPSTRMLTYASGGHPPAILIHPQQKQMTSLGELLDS
jgi:sigma-B regulation protein RsbU (phosphoserine phosphatase)